MDENTENVAVEKRWRATDFTEEDRVEDSRSACPHCKGQERLREWSTPFFIIAVVGLAGAIACLYKLLTSGSEEGGRYGLGLFVTVCVFVFGAFPLIDKSECSMCGGMGRLDAEETEDDEDEEGGEWAAHPPPE